MPAAPPQTARSAGRSAGIPAGRSWPQRRTATIAVAGLLAYAASLVATLPARVVAPAGNDASGTAWQGAATLAGGAALRWDASLVESVASGSLAARWTLVAPATALAGFVHRRPFGGSDLSARGRADWAMLAAALPGFGGDCAVQLDVALDRVARDDIRGTVASLPGACGSPPRPVRAVPRLLATFAGRDGRVTTWTDRGAALATVALAHGRLALHLTAAGAAVLPGPGRAGDVEVAL